MVPGVRVYGGLISFTRLKMEARFIQVEGAATRIRETDLAIDKLHTFHIMCPPKDPPSYLSVPAVEFGHGGYFVLENEVRRTGLNKNGYQAAFSWLYDRLINCRDHNRPHFGSGLEIL